ncbi:hypothetical protein HYV49_02655 [Candidatus Pacearchaeota archaeon]|nr:hypothetical protein [Candidatus Pacearchaeota archaeon]
MKDKTNKKGALSMKIIIIAIVIILLIGAVFYFINNILKDSSEERIIQDLTSDHLDEAFAELEEVDFSIPIS